MAFLASGQETEASSSDAQLIRQPNNNKAAKDNKHPRCGVQQAVLPGRKKKLLLFYSAAALKKRHWGLDMVGCPEAVRFLLLGSSMVEAIQQSSRPDHRSTQETAGLARRPACRPLLQNTLRIRLMTP